jgi:hypothetical protein
MLRAVWDWSRWASGPNFLPRRTKSIRPFPNPSFGIQASKYVLSTRCLPLECSSRGQSFVLGAIIQVNRMYRAIPLDGSLPGAPNLLDVLFLFGFIPERLLTNREGVGEVWRIQAGGGWDWSRRTSGPNFLPRRRIEKSAPLRRSP